MTVLQILKSVPAFLVQLGLLLLIVVVKAAQLAAERRRGVGLDPRMPTVFAACGLLVALVLGLAGQFPGFYGFTVDNHPVQYVQNISLMGAYFALQFLYLTPRVLDRRPGRRETALFLAVAGVLAVLSALAWISAVPTDDRAVTLSQHPLVALFYLVGAAYLSYVAGAVAVRGGRYVVPTSGVLRAGLLLVALAAAMQSLGSLSRVLVVAQALATGAYDPTVYQLASPLFNLSKPLLALGLALPLLVGRARAIVHWLRRRRRFRALSTLALVALQVFPDIRGTEGSTRARSERAGHGLKFRYIRRVTECRDAINRARHYENLPSTEPRETHDDAPAQRFWAELVACGATSAFTIGLDLDTEAAELARISSAMRRRGLAWLQPGGAAEMLGAPSVPDQT